MNRKAQLFFENLKRKTAAFCGYGRSNNLAIIRAFCQYGAKVTVRDKRSREQLGEEANKIEACGARLILGDGYLSDLTEDMIFRTPGMKFFLPELDAAREKGSAVLSEMELFFELCPCKIYAVTGSDGKTTTTSILSELLKAAGKRVHLGGNIGRALLPDIFDMREDDVVVVELSSFQLISMRKSADVAVVTNVSPNHLDMHKDMQEYVDAKKNVFLHQSAFGVTVLNADNEITRSFAPQARGQVRFFSRKEPSQYGAWADEKGQIRFGNGPVFLREEDILIPGLHNVENYLAAFSAVEGEVLPETCAKVARTFAGVEHRAELTRVLDGVRYYNDSIASSPTRTEKGTLSLFKQKIILLAGGYDKHIPYDHLGEVIPHTVKTLILMGDTGPRIEEAVRKAPDYREGEPAIYHADSMEQAVKLAHDLAKSGDIVSLSPASASFDMYRDFEERGRHFKALVAQL